MLRVFRGSVTGRTSPSVRLLSASSPVSLHLDGLNYRSKLPAVCSFITSKPNVTTLSSQTLLTISTSSTHSSSKRYFSSPSSPTYDVCVIGGGPGGYVAAIKAAQLGLKTVCVERRNTLGGTCLNVGCIPSKALLNISHKYHEAHHRFDQMGIILSSPPSIDHAKVMKQKEKTVKSLTYGISFLFQKNKVNHVKGTGRITGPNSVKVGDETISASNIIIATGSTPSTFPGGGVVVDGTVVVDSEGALSLPKVPKSMIVIGGGVIGLELGSVWSRMGTQVDVVEFGDKLCPSLDSEVVNKFQKCLEIQGMNMMLSSKVTGCKVSGSEAIVSVESVNGGKSTQLTADCVLLSVGRKPYTDNLGLQELGIQLDKLGRIPVDGDFIVHNFPSIRAIGDVIPGPMLAHKAEEDGIACVERIANQPVDEVHYGCIPSVVYTHPELAGVGATEDDLKKNGVEYAKGLFPMAANSRARANDDAEGLVKVLVERKTDKILGAWILGANAGDLISEMVLAMQYGASSEDVGRTCHAHPTLSEAVKEACMAAYDKPIHFG